MKTITVTVEKVEIKECVSKKTGKKFYFHEIYGGGDKYVVLRNDADQIESVGDLVNIAYETTQNGKFTNNTAKKIEVLSNDHATVFTTTTNDGNKASESRETEDKKTVEKSETKNTSTKGSGVSVPVTTRDISMEVSGLLQAIINHHGLSNDTEGRLREALQIKRRLVNELEQTGTV